MNKKPLMTSLEIMELSGKTHQEVRADIRRLLHLSTWELETNHYQGGVYTLSGELLEAVIRNKL